MAITTADIQTLGYETSDAFAEGYKSEQPLVGPMIARTVDMKAPVVDLPIRHTAGKLKVWEGARKVEKFSADRIRLESEIFELTEGVPRKAVEDDNVGLWMPQFNGMGVSTQFWPDEQLAALLETGESAVHYDGVSFFNASHPVDLTDASKGTFTNFTSGGGTAWYLIDSSKMAAKPLIWGNHIAPEFANKFSPTDDNVFWFDVYYAGVRARGGAQFGLPHLIHKSKATLDATAFYAVEAAMRGLKNPAGKSLGIRPDILLVDPSLYPTARALIESQFNSAGASNPLHNLVKVVEWKELTGV